MLKTLMKQFGHFTFFSFLEFLNLGCEITESVFSQACSCISWILLLWFIRFDNSCISPATLTAPLCAAASRLGITALN